MYCAHSKAHKEHCRIKGKLPLNSAHLNSSTCITHSLIPVPPGKTAGLFAWPYFRITQEKRRKKEGVVQNVSCETFAASWFFFMKGAAYAVVRKAIGGIILRGKARLRNFDDTITAFPSTPNYNLSHRSPSPIVILRSEHSEESRIVETSALKGFSTH